MDEYLTTLRILVMDCGFGDQAERDLMLQLVEGCFSKKTAGTFGDETVHVGSGAGHHAGK